jgi:hypothetical protein
VDGAEEEEEEEGITAALVTVDVEEDVTVVGVEVEETCISLLDICSDTSAVAKIVGDSTSNKISPQTKLRKL